MKSPSDTPITIRRARSADDYKAFVRLAREYFDELGRECLDEPGFEVDLDVERELDSAPSIYGPPGHGAALLAVDGDGALVGITGMCDLGEGRCEIKRMYVRREWRGTGVGRALCTDSIACAKHLGYAAARLNTLARMSTAVALYESLGFEQIPAYRANPLPDALFMELTL